MKRLFLFILLLTVAFTLAGCGDNESAVAATTTAPKEVPQLPGDVQALSTAITANGGQAPSPVLTGEGARPPLVEPMGGA